MIIKFMLCRVDYGKKCVKTPFGFVLVINLFYGGLPFKLLLDGVRISMSKDFQGPYPSSLTS